MSVEISGSFSDRFWENLDVKFHGEWNINESNLSDVRRQNDRVRKILSLVPAVRIIGNVAKKGHARMCDKKN